MSLCKDCWLKQKKDEEKKSENYQPSESELDESDFRKKFPAKLRTEDGHIVRSRAEQIIDNWLYHKGIVHAYEDEFRLKRKFIVIFLSQLGRKFGLNFGGWMKKSTLDERR